MRYDDGIPERTAEEAEAMRAEQDAKRYAFVGDFYPQRQRRVPKPVRDRRDGTVYADSYAAAEAAGINVSSVRTGACQAARGQTRRWEWAAFLTVGKAS